MPRLALLNMVIGFVIIFLSASLGTFIVDIMTELFISAPQLTNSWQQTLLRSAHGHVTLLGFTHILFGLTLPYSQLSTRLKFWQTVGIAAGTVAMGPLLLLKSYTPPTSDTDLLSLLIGLMLSLFLFALIFHAFGIFVRMKKTPSL